MRIRRGAVVVAYALVLGACSTVVPQSEELTPSSAADNPVSETTVEGNAATVSSTAVPLASETTTTTATSTTTPTTSTTTSSTTTSTTTTTLPTVTPYRVPVAEIEKSGWGDTHSSYPATDIFVQGCGADLVSPVNGTLLEVRRKDSWDRAVDNPATRGGRSISILGDDGVRYYMSHFDVIEESLAPGLRVSIGQFVGTLGDTGRTSACHLHFSISPPCPGKEWSVRRGAIWPYPYLNAWRKGEQLSPVDEIESWLLENPTACEEAMADPYALDS